GDTKLGIFLEPSQEEFKMVVAERDIGVQIADDVVIDRPGPGVSGVEAVRLGGEAAIAMFRHVDHFDPLVKRRIPPGDGAGTVRRAVIDDYPSDRADRLAHHRLNGLLDERLFVPCRRDENAGEGSANLHLSTISAVQYPCILASDPAVSF